MPKPIPASSPPPPRPRRNAPRVLFAPVARSPKRVFMLHTGGNMAADKTLFRFKSRDCLTVLDRIARRFDLLERLDFTDTESDHYAAIRNRPRLGLCASDAETLEQRKLWRTVSRRHRINRVWRACFLWAEWTLYEKNPAPAAGERLWNLVRDYTSGHSPETLRRARFAGLSVEEYERRRRERQQAWRLENGLGNPWSVY
jgi:hypothetical protein